MINPDPLKTPSARGLALDVLAGAERRGRWVEDLLAAALKRHPGLDRRDRALLLELVQGVKRWQLRLDFALAHLSHIPLPKLHPLVVQILRLTAFQILMLDRVPARAALHEAGQMAKARGLPKSHVGFINAVLRRLAAGELPRWPALEQDPVLALSVEHSHPGWLVQRWLARYGLEETQARLAANNRIPPLTIRVNTLKTDRESLQARLAREGVDARVCRFSPVGLELTAFAESPAGLPSYREGLWLFQDEAAQLVSLLMPLKPGQKVVEMGAGRGGKTTHLAEALDNQGMLLAVDNHRGRLAELGRTLRRWGVTIGRPLLADAAGALPVKAGLMDAAVVDAPCSGLGIIRRHPEIKGRLKEKDLSTFPFRQRAMLKNAAAILKPGGRLLYITCTTEPGENEEVVAGFLADHPDFHPATAPGLLPPAARTLISPAGCFATSPAAHNLDGFFAVVFNRR